MPEPARVDSLFEGVRNSLPHLVPVFHDRLKKAADEDDETGRLPPHLANMRSAAFGNFLTMIRDGHFGSTSYPGEHTAEDRAVEARIRVEEQVYRQAKAILKQIVHEEDRAVVARIREAQATRPREQTRIRSMGRER